MSMIEVERTSAEISISGGEHDFHDVFPHKWRLALFNAQTQTLIDPQSGLSEADVNAVVRGMDRLVEIVGVSPTGVIRCCDCDIAPDVPSVNDPDFPPAD